MALILHTIFMVILHIAIHIIFKETMSLSILDGGKSVCAKNGFLLHEALISIAMCTMVLMNLLAYQQIQMKKEELMESIEAKINASWEEIFYELKECNACLVEEEIEQEPS